MFVEVVSIRVVEAALVQLVKPILVVLTWLILDFLMAECFLRSVLANTKRPLLINTVIVVVTALFIEAPLVEEVPLFVVEAAVFKDVKPIVVVFSWELLDLFRCFFRAFNHSY